MSCAFEKCVTEFLCTRIGRCYGPENNMHCDVLFALMKPSGKITPLERVAAAARAYREEEASDTPRMWRGKKLQDLANELDDALQQLEHGGIGVHT